MTTTDLSGIERAMLDNLITSLLALDADLPTVVEALATGQPHLSVLQVQYLADRLELCPMHLCDAAICADDEVKVCAPVRAGNVDLPADFDHANPPQDQA